MSTKFFPETLKSILHQLDLTQAQLASSSQLSPSMIVKLIAGDDAHRTTYQKVFDYFKKDHPSEAKRLMEAHLMDIAAQFGLEAAYTPRVKLTSRKEKTILHMFAGLPPEIMMALYAVGHAAPKKNSVKNALLALAELTNEISDARTGFPLGYFSSRLAVPRESKWRLLGGSLGDKISSLTDPEGSD